MHFIKSPYDYANDPWMIFFSAWSLNKLMNTIWYVHKGFFLLFPYAYHMALIFPATPVRLVQNFPPRFFNKEACIFDPNSSEYQSESDKTVYENMGVVINLAWALNVLRSARRYGFLWNICHRIFMQFLDIILQLFNRRHQLVAPVISLFLTWFPTPCEESVLLENERNGTWAIISHMCTPLNTFQGLYKVKGDAREVCSSGFVFIEMVHYRLQTFRRWNNGWFPTSHD